MEQKKKVAFCLRGGVCKNSQFTTKNSIYSEEPYGDYKKCARSIFKYIIDVNPNYQIDFFCHSWNTDLQQDFINIFNPKSILTENNNLYSKEIENKCKTMSDFGGISQSLSMKKSIELKEEYEKQNNIKYDIVILYRYDVLLWKNLNLNNYILNDNTIYVNAHVGGNGDFHFVMNNTLSKTFKNLYNSIEQKNFHKHHFWIKNYVKKYMKKNLKQDLIRPGYHQEVIRKIKDSSLNKKGRLSIKLFNQI